MKILVTKSSFLQETNLMHKFYHSNVPPLLIASELKKRTQIVTKIPPKNMSIPLLVNKPDKEKKNMLKVWRHLFRIYKDKYFNMKLKSKRQRKP
jgi:hypothetical protein